MQLLHHAFTHAHVCDGVYEHMNVCVVSEADKHSPWCVCHCLNPMQACAEQVGPDITADCVRPHICTVSQH